MPPRATFRGPSAWGGGGTGGSGGGGAPTDGPYVTWAADPDLSDELLIGAIILAPDTLANRPAATAVPAGALYFPTDDFNMFRSTGAAWVSVYLVAAASTTVAGRVELATDAETTTGTSATLAVTPDGLAGSSFGQRILSVQVTDPLGVSIVNGNGQAFFRVPALLNGYSLTAVGSAVTTVSTSGLPTVQIVNIRLGTGTPNMLSTTLTIDANEKDSSTAATAAVISTGTTSGVPDKQVATGDQLRIDVSGTPTGAKGLIVQLTFLAP